MRLEEYEGLSIFYAAGPPEAQRCAATRVGVVGGGDSAGQAAVWLARGGALRDTAAPARRPVQTMSDSVGELERHGVAVRDRSEVAELHGTAGQLEAAATLADGERLPFAYLFLFLGAAPCGDWLGDTLARDANEFAFLTGSAAGGGGAAQDRVADVARPATCARDR